MKFRFPFLRCAIAVLAVGVAAPALAEVHALILTISQYQGGVPPLAGVQSGWQSATAMATQDGRAGEEHRPVE